MPVLIFVSRENCPICQKIISFEWSKIVSDLEPSIKIRRLHLKYPGQRIPFCLRKMIQWFPLFVLCSDSEWSKCFPREMPGIEIRPELSTGYIPDVLMFNGYKLEGTWELVGKSDRRPYTSDEILKFCQLTPPFKLSIIYHCREKRW